MAFNKDKDRDKDDKGRANEEKPLPPEDQLRTPAQERLEDTDQNMRIDGTTPRHTEPLGPPAPGQGGRPGPERRVVPGNSSDSFGPEKTDEEVQEERKALGEVIRVVATRMGYIHHVRRRTGDVFDIRAKEFSRTWMKTVDGSTPKKITTAKASLQAIHDDALADKVAAKSGGRSTGDRDVTT